MNGLKLVLHSVFVWMPRAVWGEIRRHQGHTIERFPWRPKYVWCATCETFTYAKRVDSHGDG